MDNAGGYGSNNAIDEYVNMLSKKYNIETIFQVPRSPYTNVLDLRVWYALQSRVEKKLYEEMQSQHAHIVSLEHI